MQRNKKGSMTVIVTYAPLRDKTEIGDVLHLKKDKEHKQISVYAGNGYVKCGYAAGSGENAKGTVPGEELYDQVTDGTECIVRYVYGNIIIAEVTEKIRMLKTPDFLGVLKEEK